MPVFTRDNVAVVATVADRLQQLLDERGIARRAVAQKAGLGENTVQKILERGTGARSDSIVKLANALRVRTEWLLTGEGPRDVDQAEASVGEDPPTTAAPSSVIDWHGLRVRGEKRAQREGLDIEPWAWDEFERLGPEYGVSNGTVVTVAGAIRVAQGFSDAGIGRPRAPRVETGARRAATSPTSPPWPARWELRGSR